MTVEGAEVESDHIVTVFPRKSAQVLQDVIDYLKSVGYVEL